jgi:cation transport ATPase
MAAHIPEAGPGHAVQRAAPVPPLERGTPSPPGQQAAGTGAQREHALAQAIARGREKEQTDSATNHKKIQKCDQDQHGISQIVSNQKQKHTS